MNIDNDVAADPDIEAERLERRDFPRLINEKIKVSIFISEKNVQLFDVKLLNVSRDGLLINCKAVLPISKKVSLTFMLSGNNLRAKGRVLWGYEQGENQYSYGINISKWSDDREKDTFNKFVDELQFQAFVSDRREISRRKKTGKTHSRDKRGSDRRSSKKIFLKCVRYNRFKNLEKNKNYHYFKEQQSGSKNRIILNGKSMINLASNNYLGLSDHPVLKEAAIKAIEKYGLGSGGSRILCGTMDLHNELERKLADFIGGEDAIVYSTGYSTNVGLLSALLNKNDIALADETCHASIFDGLLLSGTNIVPYKHNSIKSLERRLNAIKDDRSILIITEGIFSMEGDLSNLNEIYAVAKKYNTALMVDDAHATCVLGETGAGSAEHFNLKGKIDITVGTLSKAFGVVGGFVVGNSNLIHFLKHTSKAFLFTTSLPLPVTASLIAAVDLVKNDKTLRTNLWKNVNTVANGLKEMGFNLGKSASPITTVILGDQIHTFKMTEMLEKDGIFVSAVIYPAVKINQTLIRVSVMATHTEDDIRYFLDRIKKAGKKLKLI